MSVETLLAACGISAEAAVVVLLMKVRAFRTLPAFFVYMCWSLISDAALVSLQTQPAAIYFRIYEIQMVIDAAMTFAVLVELTWSVLRPLRSSLPQKAWAAIPFLIILAGLIVWPLAGLTVPGCVPGQNCDSGHFADQAAFYFRLQQSFAILRVIVFFAMAGFSQLIGIGWRSRELQVATGLGFYSILSLGITVFHTYQLSGTQSYHWLDVAGAAGYIGTLTYWVFAFATKEAERKEFSPQMANFLLLIGGTARASRVALTDFSVTKSRFKDH